MDELSNALPADLQAFLDSYVQLFGRVPPLPKAKFDFASDVDPEGLRNLEVLRHHAFYSEQIDPKIIQLICFSVLLSHSSPAASEHAKAARLLGTSWEELWAVCQLVSAVSALGPANQGGAMLDTLRKTEDSS